MRKVYFDNSSTSFPKAPGVGDAINNYISENALNISRGGYSDAYEVGGRVLSVREKLAKLFNCKNLHNVVFTSGATMGINMVMRGILKRGDHVIISSMEHNAVARTAYSMKSSGIDVSIIPCDEFGSLNWVEFEGAFKPETKLVAMLHGSNVSGCVLDAKKIGEMARKHGAYFLLDAAQTAGAVEIDMEGLNINALSVPGHKSLLGPQGIGSVLLSEDIAEEISSFVTGGTGSISDLLEMPDFLPDKLEAGTLNIPGIMGLGASLDFINEKGTSALLKHEHSLAGSFADGVSEIPGIELVGYDGSRDRVGVISLNFPERDNAEIAYILDEEYGIMTRCGLHCAPLAHKTLGTFPHGTVRFSFGYANTEEDVEIVLKALRKIIAK